MPSSFWNLAKENFVCCLKNRRARALSLIRLQKGRNRLNIDFSLAQRKRVESIKDQYLFVCVYAMDALVCLCICTRTVKRKSFNEDDSLTLYWLFQNSQCLLLLQEYLLWEMLKNLCAKRANRINVTLDFVQPKNVHSVSVEVKKRLIFIDRTEKRCIKGERESFGRFISWNNATTFPVTAQRG